MVDIQDQWLSAEIKEFELKTQLWWSSMAQSLPTILQKHVPFLHKEYPLLGHSWRQQIGMQKFCVSFCSMVTSVTTFQKSNHYKIACEVKITVISFFLWNEMVSFLQSIQPRWRVRPANAAIHGNERQKRCESFTGDITECRRVKYRSTRHFQSLQTTIRHWENIC